MVALLLMAMRRSDAEGLKNTLEGGRVNVVEVTPGEIKLRLDDTDQITLRAASLVGVRQGPRAAEPVFPDVAFRLTGVIETPGA